MLHFYYLVDKEIFVRNIQNENFKVNDITDEIVNKVFKTRKFIEVKHDFKSTKLHTSEFTKAFTWVYPLMVGKKVDRGN